MSRKNTRRHLFGILKQYPMDSLPELTIEIAPKPVIDDESDTDYEKCEEYIKCILRKRREETDSMQINPADDNIAKTLDANISTDEDLEAPRVITQVSETSPRSPIQQTSSTRNLQLLSQASSDDEDLYDSVKKVRRLESPLNYSFIQQVLEAFPRSPIQQTSSTRNLQSLSQASSDGKDLHDSVEKDRRLESPLNYSFIQQVPETSPRSPIQQTSSTQNLQSSSQASSDDEDLHDSAEKVRRLESSCNYNFIQQVPETSSRSPIQQTSSTQNLQSLSQASSDDEDLHDSAEKVRRLESSCNSNFIQQVPETSPRSPIQQTSSKRNLQSLSQASSDGEDLHDSVEKVRRLESPLNYSFIQQVPETSPRSPILQTRSSAQRPSAMESSAIPLREKRIRNRQLSRSTESVVLLPRSQPASGRPKSRSVKKVSKATQTKKEFWHNLFTGRPQKYVIKTWKEN